MQKEGIVEPFEQIDTKQAKQLIDAGNITIVDIRDPGSFQEGHIENAVSVDDSNIEEFIASADKAKPLLCYCYMGMSSQGAARYFKENGFEKVYSMEGGYMKWQNEFESAEGA